MGGHERYDIENAGVLFEDVWADKPDEAECPVCGAPLASPSVRCPSCGAHRAVCVGSCSSCVAAVCVRKRTV